MASAGDGERPGPSANAPPIVGDARVAPGTAPPTAVLVGPGIAKPGSPSDPTPADPIHPSVPVSPPAEEVAHGPSAPTSPPLGAVPMAMTPARQGPVGNGGPLAVVDGPWATGTPLAPDLAMLGEQAPPASRGSEQPGAPAPSPSPGQGVSPLVRQAAEQVIAAIRQTGEGGLDLQLSPEELGRVRITLSPAEHGLTVAVYADRSDTLDLLRRHIDTLAGAYRDIGYASLEFSFSGGDARPRGGAFADAAEGAVSEPSPLPEPATARRTEAGPAAGRLDLRF